ncbi:hypothetical protein Slin14017_G102910 [Septoria linicola]|nr:hypothetical protein Slin14017_G102910 [Septoria linicola]
MLHHYHWTADDDASRDTSPDPIVLPSSPLSGRKVVQHSTRRTRHSTPRKSRLSQQSRMTPSKEIVLDTPHLAADEHGSPWRIKVTVQAEQRDSPGKMVTRTTSIPLKSPTQRRSASPVKKRKGTPKKLAGEGGEGEVKRRGRKRKGTPIREKRVAPQLRVEESIEQPEEDHHANDAEADVLGETAAMKAEQAMQAMNSESHTPPQNRRASGRMARLSAQWSNGTGRTKRLSRAREELDEALQDAVGDGDMTLSRAEDFTMVSLESLQTTKEASFLHNSQLSRSHLSTVREADGDKSAISVSYLPSSPPKGQANDMQYPDLSAAKAQTRILSPWQPSTQRLSAQASLQSPFEPTSSAKKRKSYEPSHDIDGGISWKGRLSTEAMAQSSQSSKVQPADQNTASHQQEQQRQWQKEREVVSQQIQNANPEEVVTVEDDVQMSDVEDDEGDMWQTEASREIQQDVQTDQQIRRTYSTEDRPHDSQKSERIEDLFAHLPLKPARSKLPRTWRRSSGMDFSYVDSPAHVPTAASTTDRRHSTDGSGVLTPPSTDRSEEDEVEEEAGTIDLQDEADDQLQSEFTQPETEGTRYQDEDEKMLDDCEDDNLQRDDAPSDDEGADEAARHDRNRDEGYAPSRNDSKSPVSEGESPDEADKIIAKSVLSSSTRSTRQSLNRGTALERGIMSGSFPSDVQYEPERQRLFRKQTQQPERTDHTEPEDDSRDSIQQVANNKQKPRRRPPRRPTTDLEELLGLASSPVKASPQVIKVSAIGKPAQHLRPNSASKQQKSSPLSARHVNKISKESPSGGAKEKAHNSLLRKSLLSHSKILEASPNISDEDELAMPLQLQPPVAAGATFLSPPKLTHDPLTGQPLAQPKRRGRRKRVDGADQTESTVTDSFASKDSAQETDADGAHASANVEESRADTSMTDSFASKASDQRQLLQESAVKRKEQHLRRQAEEQALAPNDRGDSAAIQRPSTGVDRHDYATSQNSRPVIRVTYPDEEEERQQHIDAHRRVIDAVDSSAQMPDDEGTRHQEDSYEQDEQSYEQDSTIQGHQMHSYEENLNLDSPLKIKVNFNDTMSFSRDVDQTSSWLADARRRPALFDTSAAPQRSADQQQAVHGFQPVALERPELAIDDKKALQLPAVSLISKLGSTFWNAVVRPTGPTEIYPGVTAQVAGNQQNVDDSFTITLRSQLRSRYGVLSETFPWTMSHQRTLHRMLNSVTSRRHDTLIPRKGPLPKELERKANEICTSITGYRWVFIRDHAYVVHSFMHTLVSPSTIDAIKRGEVEFIGDDTAKRIRGYFDPERHGDDPVWTLERGASKSVVDFVKRHKGKITLEFVVRALGDCVLSNDALRKRLEREERGEEFERVAFGIGVR